MVDVHSFGIHFILFHYEFSRFSVSEPHLGHFGLSVDIFFICEYIKLGWLGVTFIYNNSYRGYFELMFGLCPSQLIHKKIEQNLINIDLYY